jgi:hypothetical protein
MNEIDETRIWLEQAVIGLGLCPFAKGVHSKGLIRWVSSAAREPEALVTDLIRELQFLAAADPQAVDTTLLVLPHLYADFLDFNDFLGVADAVLAELGLEGTLQIASFHPGYCFEGTAPDDITNCSNRSPHPTLHLLREESIERAVDACPDAAAIVDRNIETLRGLGQEGWRRLWSS